MDAKSRAPTTGSVPLSAMSALATVSANVPNASAAAHQIRGASAKGSEQFSSDDVRFAWKVENPASQMRLTTLKEYIPVIGRSDDSVNEVFSAAKLIPHPMSKRFRILRGASLNRSGRPRSGRGALRAKGTCTTSIGSSSKRRRQRPRPATPRSQNCPGQLRPQRNCWIAFYMVWIGPYI